MNDWVLKMTDFHGQLNKSNNPGDVRFNAYTASSSFTFDDATPFVSPEVFTIPFNAESADPGGDFDTSTFKWTCPANGFYNFKVKVVIQLGTLKDTLSRHILL